MDFRNANINDIPNLIAMRKQQLLDEGLNPVANIDSELKEYFMGDGSFISWLALDESIIVATSGLCFYQLPPTYSNPTGGVAYVTNMFTRFLYYAYSYIKTDPNQIQKQIQTIIAQMNMHIDQPGQEVPAAICGRQFVNELFTGHQKSQAA